MYCSVFYYFEELLSLYHFIKNLSILIVFGDFREMSLVLQGCCVGLIAVDISIIKEGIYGKKGKLPHRRVRI